MSKQTRISEGGQIAEQTAPGVSVASHTPTPWNLGYTGRCILREIPGMCDGEDGYAVAITSAHSLLAPSEARANAAFIVRACNSHDALVKALEEIAALDAPRTDLIGAVKRVRHIAKCALASTY